MGIFLYNVLGVVAILCSILVIGSKNPVHSIIFLILVFINVMGMVMVLSFDFLGLVILLVYGGAVAVLFLFIVMMLNIKVVELVEVRYRYLPLGFFIVLLFLLEIFMLYNFGFEYHLNDLYHVDWDRFIGLDMNIQVIGSLLYTDYVYYFLISGLILLLAMVGAICITYISGVVVKKQKIYEQVLRDYRKTIVLIKHKNKS